MGDAQRNINALISSQHELAPLSKESILEAIQQADLKYPLETTITLPPSAYYLSEDYSSINIPENPVIPAEFGELSSDQYQRPYNNKDRNQFNRNRNNDRTFQNSRNYSRSHSRGEYPKDYKDKFAHNSQNKQHHPRSHSRGRDFKNRSYSRDKNQRYQSRSPSSRYDSTKNTYTTRYNNRSRSERFRNESQERNPSYSRERNSSQPRSHSNNRTSNYSKNYSRDSSQPRSHSNNRTSNYSTKERNSSFSRGGSSSRDRNYHRTPSPSPHPLAGFIKQNPREVASNKYYCFRCGNPSHLSNNCNVYAGSQQMTSCKYCGLLHPTNQCPKLQKSSKPQTKSFFQQKN